MDILDLVKGQLSDGLMEQLSNQIGGSKDQTSNAVNSLLPGLISAVTKQGQGGKNSAIMNMIDADGDGNILDDLQGFITSGNDTNGGSNIINTLFGDKKSQVEQVVSENSGLNQQATSNLMNQLGPIVMNMIGKQKQEQGLDIGGIMNMLQGGGGGQKGGAASMISNLLDQDGDGNPMNDAVGMLGKLFGRKKR